MAKAKPVARRLAGLITRDGPVSVARFMEIALGDTDGGYYAARDPFGAAGDFTTAPEISQMFGELIGAWCADTWQRIGAPDPFALIEFGPGRGTLMVDALRALKALPACRDAAHVRLIETSTVLCAVQRKALHDQDATWYNSLPPADGIPAIIIANEFLDALPIRQFVKSEGAWRERCVDIDPQGDGFRFTLGTGVPQTPHAPELLAAAFDGDIMEESPAIVSLVGDIAARIAVTGGAALFIDYGHARSAVGDTLQAVQRHKPVNPLDSPGAADLTAHVDFQRVREAAAAGGARCWGPIDQGSFLTQIGIRERATQLRAAADTHQTSDINAALTRLIGPAEMGTLFKILALSEPRLEQLAGFEYGADHDA
ncbi:MAG: methyltransferase [Rhodospirillaceae bacterium]|nr:methyltransferase [Rhodospirillaceae bacterium]